MVKPKKKRKPVTTWRAFNRRAVGTSLLGSITQALAATDNSKIGSGTTLKTPRICTGKTPCSNPACPLCRRLAFEHGK